MPHSSLRVDPTRALAQGGEAGPHLGGVRKRHPDHLGQLDEDGLGLVEQVLARLEQAAPSLVPQGDQLGRLVAYWGALRPRASTNRSRWRWVTSQRLI
jgi:hypothetical protein